MGHEQATPIRREGQTIGAIGDGDSSDGCQTLAVQQPHLVVAELSQRHQTAVRRYGHAHRSTAHGDFCDHALSCHIDNRDAIGGLIGHEGTGAIRRHSHAAGVDANRELRQDRMGRGVHQRQRVRVWIDGQHDCAIVADGDGGAGPLGAGGWRSGRVCWRQSRRQRPGASRRHQRQQQCTGAGAVPDKATSSGRGHVQPHFVWAITPFDSTEEAWMGNRR